MEPRTLGDLFSQPAFLSLFAAILITVANVVVGVSILPKDRRQKRYRLHRHIFLAVLFCFLVYLGVNYFHKGNSIFDYGVFAYFLVLIPLSRKFNVTAHAILASVGLVLLTVVATLNMFTPPP